MTTHVSPFENDLLTPISQTELTKGYLCSAAACRHRSLFIGDGRFVRKKAQNPIYHSQRCGLTVRFLVIGSVDPCAPVEPIGDPASSVGIHLDVPSAILVARGLATNLRILIC